MAGITTTAGLAVAAHERRPLVVLSNRLPVALHVGENGDVDLREAAGGLATAMAGVHHDVPFTWIGWPGAAVPDARRAGVDHALGERSYVPVHIAPELEGPYYRGMCNSVLWPAFHYFVDRVAYDDAAWAAYVAVNQAFAETAADVAPPGAHAWVHDYHLMLVPAMLRARRPDLRISFFLHIPFPSSEIYRTLPKRADLLAGVLGADYIGFHTGDYARHFRSSCLRVLGMESALDSISVEGRRVGLGVHPLGPDVGRLQEALRTDVAARRLTELRERWRGRRVLVGVERLDYSKAIPLKLQAFEEFLRRDLERARRTVLVQVVVPSRLDTDEYRELKDEIELLVGRINGRYGRPGITPLEYLHRSLGIAELVALYRAADVGVVIPARDGMNLVAQEFVLCQAEPLEDEAVPGTLVLSEFAGCAHSLARALLTNPWDAARVADALEEALDMESDDRRDRMERMRERVLELDSRRWAQRFLDAAETVPENDREAHAPRQLGQQEERDIFARARDAERRVLLLDYDGTLRELTGRPLDARPTGELRTLLQRLARLPATDVHVISGRDRRTLAAWLGDLPTALCAEHGFAWRKAGQDEWTTRQHVELGWLSRVEALLRRIEAEVDGSEVERKPCAVAWHYRMVDADYGEWRARELRLHLEEQLAGEPVDILLGRKVIEVRAAGVNKGRYVEDLRPGERTFVLAMGDDRTDVDVYRALPPGSVSIHVGTGGERNLYRIESPSKVRAFLGRFADALEPAR